MSAAGVMWMRPRRASLRFKHLVRGVRGFQTPSIPTGNAGEEVEFIASSQDVFLIFSSSNCKDRRVQAWCAPTVPG